MRFSNRNSTVGNLIVGPGLIIVAILCLWENEGRFDYYEAARQTTAVTAPAQGDSKQTVSYTGTLKECVIQGKYVTRFAGYYQVSGQAEIYSWDRREDQDGEVTWSKGWYSRLDNNTRNRGLTQKLEDVHLLADQYQVQDLVVKSEHLHFADPPVPIAPHELQLSQVGKTLGLQPRQGYFYLNKSGGGDRLGDERLRFEGIPTAETATYFGLVEDSMARGKQFEHKKGLISWIIKDDGILHHLVNGTRPAALETVQSHLRKLKWTVRGIGTAAIIVGLMLFFSKFLHFLIAIPLLGNLVGAGMWVVSVILGLGVSIITITTSMLFHNPWVGLLLLVAVAGLVFFLVSSKNEARANAQKNLQPQQDSRALASDSAAAGSVSKMDPHQRARKVFTNLVKISMTDGKLDNKENRFLADWGRSKGLSDQTIVELFDQAKKRTEESLVATEFEDLYFLISLAMSDGYMSALELQHIILFGQKLGMSRSQVNAVIGQVRRGELRV